MPDFWQVEHCSTSIDDVLCHFRKRGTRKTAQPVPISHCHFPLRVWERISSHFFTFFTFFTYADLGTLGTRQGGPDLGTSGPRDLGTSGPRRVGLSISVVRVVRVRDAQPVFLRGVEL